MPRSKNCCRTALLLIGLLFVSSGCQLLPGFGGMHRTNRYGVPVQGEPDVSELDESESFVE